MWDYIKSIFTGEMETPEEKAAKEERKKFDILKYDGIRALRRNAIDYAEQCLESALQLQREPEAIGILARIYANTERVEKARDLYRELTEKDAQNVSHHLELAQIQHQLKEYEEALATCETALALEPQNANILYIKGVILYSKGDLIMAIAALTQALNADSNMCEALLKRAEILFEMGDTNEAKKDTGYIIEAQKGLEEEALLLTARIEFAQENYDQCIDQCYQVIKTNPFQKEAYLLWSKAYLNNNNPDQALKIINDAIELMPEYAKAYYLRGKIKQLTGNEKEAIEDYQKATQLEPEIEKNISGKFNYGK